MFLQEEHLPALLHCPFEKPDIIISFTSCSPSTCSSLLVSFFLATFRAFSGTPESSPALVLLLSICPFCRDKHTRTHCDLHAPLSPPVCLQRSHAVDSFKVMQEIRSGSSVISDYQLLFPSFENIRAGAAGSDSAFIQSAWDVYTRRKLWYPISECSARVVNNWWMSSCTAYSKSLSESDAFFFAFFSSCYFAECDQWVLCTTSQLEMGDDGERWKDRGPGMLKYT